MATFLILSVLVLLFSLAAIIIPPFMTKRAAREVIFRFLAAGALGPPSARSMEELGLRPDNLLQGMTGVRDYKPRALEVLVEGGIVLSTDDGKLYLSEGRLKEGKKKPPEERR